MRWLQIKCYKGVVRLFLTELRDERGITDEVLFDMSLLEERDDAPDRRNYALQDKAVGKFKACPKTGE